MQEIENSERITWLEGDLSLAYFGLTEARFTELAVQTDHVIHNAAWVNGTDRALTRVTVTDSYF